MENRAYSKLINGLRDLLSIIVPKNSKNEDLIFFIQQATEAIKIEAKEEKLTPIQKENLLLSFLLCIEAIGTIRLQDKNSLKSSNTNIRDIVKLIEELHKVLKDLMINKSSKLNKLSHIFSLNSQLQKCLEKEQNKPSTSHQVNEHYPSLSILDLPYCRDKKLLVTMLSNFFKVSVVDAQEFAKLTTESQTFLNDSLNNKPSTSNQRTYNTGETSSHQENNDIGRERRELQVNRQLNTIFSLSQHELNGNFSLTVGQGPLNATFDETKSPSQLDKTASYVDTSPSQSTSNPHPFDLSFTFDETISLEHYGIFGRERRELEFTVPKKLRHTRKPTCPDDDIVDPWYNAEVTNELDIELKRVLSEKHNKETTNIVENIRKRIWKIDIPTLSKRDINDLLKRLRQEMELVLFREQEPASSSSNLNVNRYPKIDYTSKFDILDRLKNKTSPDGDVVDPVYNVNRARELLDVLEREFSENCNEESINIINIITNIRETLNNLHYNTQIMRKHEVNALIKMLIEQLESAMVSEQEQRNIKNRNLDIDFSSKFDTIHKIKNNISFDERTVDPRYNNQRIREVFEVLESEFFENYNEETTIIINNIRDTLNNVDDIENMKKHKIDALIKKLMNNLESALVKEQQQNFARRFKSNIENRNPETDYTSKFDVLATLKNKTSPDGNIVDPRYNIDRIREVLDVLEREFSEDHNEESLTIINNIRETLTNLGDEINYMRRYEIEALIKTLIEELESSLAREQSFITSSNSSTEILNPDPNNTLLDIVVTLKNKRSQDGDPVDKYYNNDRIDQVINVLEKIFLGNYNEKTRTIANNVNEHVKYLCKNFDKFNRRGIDDVIKFLMEQLELALVKEQASKSSESNVKNRKKINNSDTAKKDKENSGGIVVNARYNKTANEQNNNDKKQERASKSSKLNSQNRNPDTNRTLLDAIVTLKNKRSQDGDVVDKYYNNERIDEVINLLSRIFLEKNHDEETKTAAKNIKENVKYLCNNLEKYSKRGVDDLIKLLMEQLETALGGERTSRSSESNLEDSNDHTSKFVILALLKTQTSSDKNTLDPKYNMDRIDEVIDILQRYFFENHNKEIITRAKNIKIQLIQLRYKIRNFTKRETDELIKMLLEDMESALAKEQVSKSSDSNVEDHNLDTNYNLLDIIVTLKNKRSQDGDSVDKYYNRDRIDGVMDVLERLFSENHNEETKSTANNVNEHVNYLCKNFDKFNKCGIDDVIKYLMEQLESALVKEQASKSSESNVKDHNLETNHDLIFNKSDTAKKNKENSGGAIVNSRYNTITNEQNINDKKQERASKSSKSNIENRNPDTDETLFDIIFMLKNKQSSDPDAVNIYYNNQKIRELLYVLETEFVDNHNEETMNIVNNIRDTLINLGEEIENMRRLEINDLFITSIEQLESALIRERQQNSTRRVNLNNKNYNPEIDYDSKFDVFNTLLAKTNSDKYDVDVRYNIDRIREVMDILDTGEFFENCDEETIAVINKIRRALISFKLGDNIKKFKKCDIDEIIKIFMVDLESALVREQEQNSITTPDSTDSRITNHNLQRSGPSNLNIVDKDSAPALVRQQEQNFIRTLDSTDSSGPSKLNIVDKIKLQYRQDINKLGTKLQTSLANLSSSDSSISDHLDDISKVTNEIQEYVNQVQQVAPPKKTGNTSKKTGDDVTDIGPCEICGRPMYLEEFTGEEPQGTYRTHHRGACSKNKVNNESEEISDLKIKLDMEIKKNEILHKTMTNLLKDQSKLIKILCNEDKQSGKELQKNKAHTDGNESLKMFKHTLKLLEEVVNKYKEKLSELTEETLQKRRTM